MCRALCVLLAFASRASSRRGLLEHMVLTAWYYYRRNYTVDAG